MSQILNTSAINPLSPKNAKGFSLGAELVNIPPEEIFMAIAEKEEYMNP
jgi:hypothetical protein